MSPSDPTDGWLYVVPPSCEVDIQTHSPLGAYVLSARVDAPGGFSSGLVTRDPTRGSNAIGLENKANATGLLTVDVDYHDDPWFDDATCVTYDLDITFAKCEAVCPEGDLEPDDFKADATPVTLSAGTQGTAIYTNRVVRADDGDTYKVTVPNGCSLTAQTLNTASTPAIKFYTDTEALLENNLTYLNDPMTWDNTSGADQDVYVLVYDALGFLKMGGLWGGPYCGAYDLALLVGGCPP